MQQNDSSNGLRISWPSLTDIMQRYGPWPMLAIGLVAVLVALLVRFVDLRIQLTAQADIDRAQTTAIEAVSKQVDTAVDDMHDAVLRREQREIQHEEDSRRLLESLRQLAYETCLLSTDGKTGRDRCLNAFWREGGPLR